MSEPRDGLPAVWTTHLAKVLVGEQPCLLAPWLNARFKFEKSNREQTALAAWKANHTELLTRVVDGYRAEGWKCQVERFFRVSGQTAVLSGKADLVIQKADSRPKIVDTKSGTPRESDVAQVLIEMVAIPLAWNVQMIFDGEVVYPNHRVKVTPLEAAEFRPRVFAMLKKLGTSPRPQASPSESACRFCEVPESECPDRWKADNVSESVTQEF